MASNLESWYNIQKESSSQTTAGVALDLGLPPPELVKISRCSSPYPSYTTTHAC